jgi:hypothetical protein
MVIKYTKETYLIHFILNIQLVKLEKKDTYRFISGKSLWLSTQLYYTYDIVQRGCLSDNSYD